MEPDCELLWCEFTSSASEKILFGTYYRPPSTGLSISNCFVNLSLLLITNSIRYFWLLISICPTLNGLTKYVFPQRLSIGMFTNYISDVCLTQVNNYPTRNSIVDLLLPTVPDLLIDDLCSYQNVVDSDRNCLSFKIVLSSNYSRPVLKEVFNYKKANFEKLYRTLSYVPWHVAMLDDDQNNINCFKLGRPIFGSS